MAIDPGRARWGLATGSTETNSATPLVTLTGTYEHKLREVERLCKREKTQLIVVGRPVHMDDTPHENTKYSDHLLADLTRMGLHAIPIDERLTTFAAQERLRQQGRSFARDKGLIDRVAAAIILEDAFHSNLLNSFTSESKHITSHE